ncbi:hypothetical protein SLS60_004487 [Paraconiothyrium brasiliense]|uniref:Uncharacterized protein n=1 Tax=Paraconiothyrium brasiliense TaxID=300254 RepID=A0ABR3RKH9_9PLEO
MSKTDVSQYDDSPKGRSLAVKDLQDSIVRREGFVRKILGLVDDNEDLYRIEGTLYHTTNLQARSTSVISAHAQQRLRATFSDFHVWNEPLLKIRELATKVLWECRPNGTLEALLEREKITADLWVQLRQSIDALDDDSEGLYQMVNASINLPRWYLYDDKADEERGFRLPTVKGPEWEKFREWVYTLPETHKSMFNKHNPRSLDVLASEMLYKSWPVLWDGHWNAPKPVVKVDDEHYNVFSMFDIDALTGSVNHGGPADEVYSDYVAKVFKVIEKEFLEDNLYFVTRYHPR